MRVLIADDDAIHRAVLGGMLRADGHSVIEAADGAEALDALAREAVDLVISDILMPRIDGYRLCMELRKDARWRELPFILHSATYASPADAKLGLGLGADVFLLKPADATALRTALTDALRRPSRDRRESPQAGTAVIKEYGEQLVDKLHQKNLELAARTRALEESEARFRQLAENIQEVFWMTDPAKNEMLYVSPAYEKIWGRTCASLYAAPRDWLEAIHPDDRERVRLAMLTKQARGDYAEEFRIVRPDGVVRWIRDQAFPVRDQAGGVFRVAGVAEDITARRELEEQLRRSQRLEAIGMLSSGIAHDLNNILTPVLMATKMLRSSLTTARDRELMGLVETSALRGASIVRQLLTFSRGIGGQRVSVQVRHLIKEMANIVRETFPRSINLVENADSDLWPVVADATQLHQVLLNLCVNARDAMPDGGELTIEARNVYRSARDAALERNAGEGPYVLLIVRDTGHGIPREIVDRIFEPFFTTKGVGDGTGLGLSTVAGIVRSHGGFVTVDSGPARGSAFHVYVPASRESVTPVEPDGTGDTARGHGETILVVDDEPTILTAARIYLERNGYRVLTASNGQEGLVMFTANQHEVKLVVTDMMMPVMNGVAFVQALQALQPNVRMIAAMGMASETRETQLAALGVNEILQKPYEPRELLAALRRVLALTESSVSQN